MSQDVIAYPLTARYTVIKAKEAKTMKQIKIDEQEEERINDAYARVAEEATGIKPMSEDPEYQHVGKQTSQTVIGGDMERK